MLKLSKIHM